MTDTLFDTTPLCGKCGGTRQVRDLHGRNRPCPRCAPPAPPPSPPPPTARGGGYGRKMRQHLEQMYDRERAQNAAAYGLINMFPDPERGGGYHSKQLDGINRRILERTFRRLGMRDGVPGIGVLTGLPVSVAKHVDNSQTKRIGQHAYSLQKMGQEDRVTAFIEVCLLRDDESVRRVVRDMASRFVSSAGPTPVDVHGILEIEEIRLPPPVENDVVHIWEGPLHALCGSTREHVCDGLGAMGYRLSFTSNYGCSSCGAPVCPRCRLLQEPQPPSTEEVL